MGVLFSGGVNVTFLPMPVPLWLDLNRSGSCPDSIVVTGTLALAPAQTVTEI